MFSTGDVVTFFISGTQVDGVIDGWTTPTIAVVRIIGTDMVRQVSVNAMIRHHRMMPRN